MLFDAEVQRVCSGEARALVSYWLYPLAIFVLKNTCSKLILKMGEPKFILWKRVTQN